MSFQTINVSKILPTLMQEDSSLEVALLQRLLVFYQYLFKHSVDGIFDAATDNAVRQFQHDNALYEDGIVGSHTWSALADLD